VYDRERKLARRPNSLPGGRISVTEAKGKPIVIAALGTSLTARGAWLERLPAALESLIHRPVRALNFARAGATSRRGLAAVDDAARIQPDIAIIEFAINDAALHRRVPLAESAANLTAIIRSLRASNETIRLHLMTMSPAIGLRGLLRPRLARYYDLYTSLAARERAGLIDNRADWAALPPEILARALPDGSHPTPEFAVSITLTNVVRALVRDLGLVVAGELARPSSVESNLPCKGSREKDPPVPL
jgi:lysophospholipase L1-like esterase